MKLFFSAAVLVVCLLLGECNSASSTTNPNLQRLFVGRCDAWTLTDCDILWNAFYSVATLDPTITPNQASEWDPLFEIADFSTPPNRALFWSGGLDFPYSFSIAQSGYFTTLEGTSTGFIVNGLSWCGKIGASPAAFEFVNDCPYVYPNASWFSSQILFWQRASLAFASNVSGNITSILTPRPVTTGGPYQAFRNNSIFATIELPTLLKRSASLTAVTVIVLPIPNIPNTEKCNQGSLLTLKNIVSASSVPFYCLDNPSDIINHLCSLDKNCPECMMAFLAFSVSPLTGVANPTTIFDNPLPLILSILVAVLFIVILALIVLLVQRKSDDKKYNQLE